MGPTVLNNFIYNATKLVNKKLFNFYFLNLQRQNIYHLTSITKRIRDTRLLWSWEAPVLDFLFIVGGKAGSRDAENKHNTVSLILARRRFKLKLSGWQRPWYQMLKSLMETTDKLELVSAKSEKQRNKLWTEQLKLVL